MKDSPEAVTMPREELAFDLGILVDAGLGTSTVTLDWFMVAWLTSGATWAKKAQKLLDEVVGRDGMPTFEDRPKLAYIDAIGMPPFSTFNSRSSILTSYSKRNPPLAPCRRLRRPSLHKDRRRIHGLPLKDLPQTGFGFGRRICTGRLIARNQLFIQMARMLWAFDVEAGVVDEETGRRHEVHDMDCTEGFVTLPKPFRAVMRPREWVRDRILERGSTHGLHHARILEKARLDRS
jgi:hypothetical protein